MITRRAHLGGLLASSFIPYLAPQVAKASTLPHGPFGLGVASGDPSNDGFVIWTRLSIDPLASDGKGGLSGAIEVKYEVYEDEAALKKVGSGSIYAHQSAAHSVHVTLYGLKANRPYWYRFFALGSQSPLGCGRTLADQNTNPQSLRLGFVSCSHYEQGYFSAYRHLAAERPDYVLYLGDYIYEYSLSNPKALVRSHDQSPEVTDLAGYRNRYALYRTDLDLQALHAGSTALMTWDDHEVENDYANLLSQDVGEDKDFLKRRLAAYQAYYEHMPLRRSSRLKGQNLKLYKSYRFGDLAQINMLDGRQYRSAPACPLPHSRRGRVVEAAACDNRLDPKRSMLGMAQEKWLYSQFAQSKARWNILGQDLIAASLRQPGKNAEGQEIWGHFTDGWDGYPATRDRLLGAIEASKLSNPVIFSGDIHSFWANEVKKNPFDPETKSIATEFVGSSVTANGPPFELFQRALTENPHVRYFESRNRGYVSVTLTPKALSARYMAISDRRDLNASVSLLKSFVVESGKPEIIAQ
jgi:alkaline phosphatase D